MLQGEAFKGKTGDPIQQQFPIIRKNIKTRSFQHLEILAFKGFWKDSWNIEGWPWN